MKSNLLQTAREEVVKEYAISHERISEDIQLIKDWLKKQPHLPFLDDDERIERFLLMNKFNVEKTKKRIDTYYSVRGEVPELFENRDPLSPELTTIMETVAWIPIPQLTEKYERIFVGKLLDIDPENFDPWQFFKYAFMQAEIKISEDYYNGEHFVFDMDGLKFKHIIKITPTLLKKCSVVGTEAFSSKVNGMHIINAPNMADNLIRMAKMVMKPKLAERIYVHKNSTSLFNVLPQDIMPTEYGGNGQSIEKLSHLWREDLIKKRDWFLEQMKIKTDESKRPEKSTNEQLFGSMHGTFRKLDLD